MAKSLKELDKKIDKEVLKKAKEKAEDLLIEISREEEIKKGVLKKSHLKGE